VNAYLKIIITLKLFRHQIESAKGENHKEGPTPQKSDLAINENSIVNISDLVDSISVSSGAISEEKSNFLTK
jgi:hypothetical protein